MSQQARAAALLRQAADLLNCDAHHHPPPSTSTLSTTTTSSAARALFAPTTTSSAARALFAPYSANRRSGTRRGRVAESVQSHWTHKFSIVPRCKDETVPSREEKFQLYSAGLGEKRITFVKNTKKEDFDSTLEKAFPKLRGCGGYELMRTPPGSKITLEHIVMPVGGYTSKYLSDDSSLGQAICYIRPIQKDLDTGKEEATNELSEPCQECMTCGDMVPINVLREHVENCTDKVHKKEECHSADKDIEMETGMGVCPICQKGVSLDMLATHAAGCGDSRHSLDTSPVDSHQPISEQYKLRSVKECLDDLYQGLSDVKPWTVTVVRRKFLQTAMEQLEDATEEEWGSLLSVRFIGEEGVDAGGPKREFFTLLFKESDVFEMKSLSLDPHLMDKGTYRLMGKAVALSLMYGHPGPRCLSQEITSYIIEETIPDFSEMDARDIQQADVIDLVNKIEEATETNIEGVYQNGFSLIEPTGYKHRLTMGKKHELINALKAHYSFYRVLGPLIQFVDGLKSFGVLEVLRKDPTSKKYFLHGTFSSAEDIVIFFKPKFSEDPTEKEVEEVVVYNFTKFVKRTERSAITSNVINLEDGAENQIVITTGHLLNALVGSSMLPTNISFGSIVFDHTSNSLPSVNTCLPSILFSQTKQLLEYDRFEECLKLIIVGAPDFGMV